MSTVQLDGPFHFGEPSIEGRVVSLPYRFGSGQQFVERVELPAVPVDGSRRRAALRALQLVAGVSYYKCIAPAPLVVPPLTDAERRLVLALYDEGLREFAYRNGYEVPLPVELVDEPDAWPGPMGGTGPLEPVGAAGDPVPQAGPGGAAAGALVPVGGGKDSALVAELVPEGVLFAVNPVGAHRTVAAALGRPLHAAQRTLDPLLRELVEAGAPNGHVPVTAITSAISVLAALGLGVRDVLMGIERSADEPSLVTPGGVAVNHQYSKSWAAEQLLRDVFAPTGIRYLSLLRPLTELGIGAAIARRPSAGHIVSCNRVFTVWNENTASREQRPCGSCAKCLFTSLMVAPSSTPEAIEERYGRALLDDPGNVEAVRELWSTEKPFDCVGERLESAAAVVLLSRTDGWRDQAVVEALTDEAEGLLGDSGVDVGEFLRLGPLDELPEEYRPVLADLAGELASVPGLARAAH